MLLPGTYVPTAVCTYLLHLLVYLLMYARTYCTYLLLFLLMCVRSHCTYCFNYCYKYIPNAHNCTQLLYLLMAYVRKKKNRNHQRNKQKKWLGKIRLFKQSQNTQTRAKNIAQLEVVGPSE